jgi:hypothetical protein
MGGSDDGYPQTSIDIISANFGSLGEPTVQLASLG